MSITTTPYGFIPTQVSGLVLWLDASDPTTITQSSGSISQWRDKSSSALTATGVSNPTLVANIQNGFPGISLDGSTQYFNLGNNLNMGTNQIYIFIVSKFNSTADGAIIGKSLYGSQGGRYSLLRNGAMIPLIEAGGGVVNNSGLNSDTSTSARLLNMVWDRSTINLYQNGTSVFSVGLSDTSNLTTGNSLLIGAYQNGSGGTPPVAGFYMNGYIHEILMYFTSTGSPLGDTARQQIESYLAQKWGLTLGAGHPGLTSTVYRSTYLKNTVKKNIATMTPFYTGFSPRQISGLALWLDAADSSTITGTSPVTQWRDKSVNNYSMTYTGSPTYRTTAALNNLGCITFNGTSSFNSGTDTMYWSAFSISQPFTVFAVCTKRLSSNTNFSFVLEPSTPSGSVILYGGLQLKMYAGSADQYTNPILAFVANSTQIYSAVFNGASSLLAYGGNATSSLNPGTASWPGLYLGRDWGGVYDSGDYGEILFYNSALSTTQRQQVESYLAQKWGLTSSLPAGHLHLTQPAGALTALSLVNSKIIQKGIPAIVYTTNWTYSSLPSQANLILQVNSRNWTSSASILDSITGVAWNMTNASLSSTRNTIVMTGNGLIKYNNAGAGPAGFSGTQHTVMMVYYRLANATTPNKGNPTGFTLNMTGYLYTINRNPSTITNQILAGENSSWVYQSNYQVGTNQTVLDGTTGWIFIAFVYTGTTLNVYLNGQPENNTNGVSNPATTTVTNNYFSIFGDPRNNSSYINGELAFYGLWNTQLTSQNILDFYNANKAQFMAFP